MHRSFKFEHHHLVLPYRLLLQQACALSWCGIVALPIAQQKSQISLWPRLPYLPGASARHQRNPPQQELAKVSSWAMGKSTMPSLSCACAFTSPIGSSDFAHGRHGDLKRGLPKKREG
mmetsp:Transcript_64493/g.151537  ORF Transcript_64493/g.151537 Transcript_64493/m.151537 type:complete len:118 (-) Transcript_64493:9-362(-)